MSLEGDGSFEGPLSLETVLSELESVMGPIEELTEVSVEPQTRTRSNTWPKPRPENHVDPADECGAKKETSQNVSGAPPLTNTAIAKKIWPRRNAWGNRSYADLITDAINSSPGKRLTLSEIYEWMVQNVPCLKDKEATVNSTTTWKNSIRHNLSLNNQFIRIPNEDTEKSSWWLVDPDAKPGTSERRRALSAEASKSGERRGRVMKKPKALRKATPSPNSSISESIDLFPDLPVHGNSFQLSPDFRQRASPNASSRRLSPIPSLVITEPEWATDYAPDGGGTDDGMMVQSGALRPETAEGQIMGALNTELADDLNIDTLEHSFDFNVDEMINHELRMHGSLDFNFPQQDSAMAAEANSQPHCQTAGPRVPHTQLSPPEFIDWTNFPT